MMIQTDSFKNLKLVTLKRRVLAQIASISNLLRYLITITIKIRLFLKQLWSQNKDWDDTMKEENLETWRQIISETKGSSLIQINRHVTIEQSPLFCFCDASKDAYAMSIYLKTMVEGKLQINLIFSKETTKKQSNRFNQRRLDFFYKTTMITESPDKAHTTPFSIVKARFSSLLKRCYESRHRSKNLSWSWEKL